MGALGRSVVRTVDWKAVRQGPGGRREGRGGVVGNIESEPQLCFQDPSAPERRDLAGPSCARRWLRTYLIFVHTTPYVQTCVVCTYNQYISTFSRDLACEHPSSWLAGWLVGHGALVE